VFAVFAVQSTLFLIISVALFAVQAWAFADAAFRRPDAFVAADKLTKPGWMIILGIALVAHLLVWNPVSFLNLIGAVAAIVYMVDARPAMQALTRR
jgi:hypothetical protein